jgi:hypothetical protein
MKKPMNLQLFADALMRAQDSISGANAKCYVTIDGNRYNFMTAISLEASFEKSKEEIPILGKTVKGNKAVGGKGSGSMDVHYNTSIMRKLMIKYMNTGEDFYFDIQVTNEDPTSSVGRQTVILQECNLDSSIITQFDADATYLTEALDFTFEKATMPEEFSILDGMI